MSFSQFNLHPKILKALELCGYTNPTPIQTQSIPEVMKGKDLVASAQTGTGKTASFVLPALHRLVSNKATSRSPRVLILTPTRELANQITDAISKYARFMQCSVVSIVGGMSYKTQFNNLSRPVDIIVATPGRLLDHMSNRKIDLSHVELLVLDEADRMLDMGFVDDVREIASATPSNRQTLLFSATMDDALTPIINKFMKQPKRIDLSQENISPNSIEQKVYYADNSLHKSKLLIHFLTNENIYKAIIFSATKVNADALAYELNELGIKAAALHGDMKQGARNRITEQFKRGKIQFLVATDVASRGIDVKDITHVINFDLPRLSEDYVHRIGRTGRAGKEGIAISFISPFDAKHIGKIERFINQRLQVHTIPGLEPDSNTGANHRPGKKEKGRHRDRDRDKGRGSFKDREKENKRRHFEKRSHGRDQRLGKVYREKQKPENNQFDPDEIREWQEKLDQKRPLTSDKKERGAFRGRSLNTNDESRKHHKKERDNRDEKQFKDRDRSGPGRKEKRPRFDDRNVERSRDERQFKDRDRKAPDRKEKRSRFDNRDVERSRDERFSKKRKSSETSYRPSDRPSDRRRGDDRRKTADRRHNDDKNAPRGDERRNNDERRKGGERRSSEPRRRTDRDRSAQPRKSFGGSKRKRK